VPRATVAVRYSNPGQPTSPYASPPAPESSCLFCRISTAGALYCSAFDDLLSMNLAVPSCYRSLPACLAPSPSILFGNAGIYRGFLQDVSEVKSAPAAAVRNLELAASVVVEYR